MKINLIRVFSPFYNPLPPPTVVKKIGYSQNPRFGRTRRRGCEALSFILDDQN